MSVSIEQSLFVADNWKHLAFAGIIGGLAWVAPASAGSVDEPVALCDNCPTYQGYTSAAENAVFRGDVYVLNRPDGVIKQFLVIREIKPGSEFIHVTEITPDSGDLPELQAVLEVYGFVTSQTPVSINDLNLPPGVNPNSVIDLVGNSSWRATVRNAIESWAQNQVASWLADITGDSLELISEIPASVLVEFPDTSTARLEYQYPTTTAGPGFLLIYELVEGIGPDGHSISSFTSMQGVNVSGSSQTISEWINAAGRLGIPVTGPGGGPAPGNISSITCGPTSCIACDDSGCSSHPPPNDS